MPWLYACSSTGIRGSAMSSVSSQQRAARRAAKTARRKKVKAQRQQPLVRIGASSALAAEMRQLASAPVHACLLQEGMWERGNGVVVLIRRTPGGRFALIVFLVDVFCLGVKDVLFDRHDAPEIEAFIEAMNMTAPLRPVDPSRARKLLRDLVAWSRSLGIEPHVDYAAGDLLFGDIAADACSESFTFGSDGKPFYIPGPHDSPAKIRRQMDHLRRRLGEDGFDFMLELGEDEFDEDFADDDIECVPHDASPYDPLNAPDKEEWLALDEDEQIVLVRNYHRRAGLISQEEATHAAFHVAVETQIAKGDELPVRRTVERLMTEGLDRHEAVHAVSTAIIEHMQNALKTGSPENAESDEAYYAIVERLTAEGWRRDYADEDDSDAEDDAVRLTQRG